MNVLIINGSADIYGASRILLQVIQFLKPRKIILVVPSKGPLTDAIETNAEFSNVFIEVIEDLPLVSRKLASVGGVLDVISKIRASRKALKVLVLKHSVDWAYINTLACFIMLRIVKSLGLRRLLHVHEMLESDRVLTRMIVKYALCWSDKVIAVSDAVRENLLKSCRKKDSYKIVTVLNGISDKYDGSIKKEEYEGKIVITFFGRIIILKGIWFFLESIKLIPATLLDKCVFRIFGGPAPGGEALIHKLKDDIARHPAQKSILFLPFIDDITVELNRSDIIVVPSLLKDSFPTIVLEGLSAGKPVISTDTGGAKQSIDNGVTGFLIPPYNDEVFADKMKLLIEDDVLRKEMGRNARNQFLNRFTSGIFQKGMVKELDDFEVSMGLHSDR